eukprot:CAMPEP_0118893242 /NCGR_PEP_ID=MMETSP1166-20130328/2529_1 /TAXON_ID=1104430 /ORGANISM="Chrysoreinhardia sp, Strain CCMP3193" /LENGTH=243 /DNA_ID=CAMNT_0006832035 /DNA_START=237 /DNA_END=970 /DNA_ORIENTATION=-
MTTKFFCRASDQPNPKSAVRSFLLDPLMTYVDAASPLLPHAGLVEKFRGRVVVGVVDLEGRQRRPRREGPREVDRRVAQKGVDLQDVPALLEGLFDEVALSAPMFVIQDVDAHRSIASSTLSGVASASFTYASSPTAATPATSPPQDGAATPQPQGARERADARRHTTRTPRGVLCKAASTPAATPPPATTPSAQDGSAERTRPNELRFLLPVNKAGLRFPGSSQPGDGRRSVRVAPRALWPS